MALIQVNFSSNSLKRMVPIQVILPVEKLEGTARGSFPTLYLLHGVTGNYTDWVSRTNIQRWAEAKGLAVVMPSGDNGFYVDHPGLHNCCGTFIGQELVEITRKMFPLSRCREDTFIAGLSMGGYGAVRNGLKYHETFSHIAGLSTANVVEGIEARTNDDAYFLNRRDFAESIFGDLSKVKDSDKSLRWLAERLAEAGAAMPRIYLACGTEDTLLGDSRALRDCLRKTGADVTYEEGPGGHEWDFWERHIRRVIDWLPL
ncbi:MAG: esterase family protein [Oscillospiraceae bacterium]|nr:esterase family protein [Oscillospiraceae bacterium]